MTEVATWSELIYNISPYSWAYIGIAIALGCSIIGAAWYFPQFTTPYNHLLGVFSSLVQVLSVVLLKLPESDQRILSGSSEL